MRSWQCWICTATCQQGYNDHHFVETHSDTGEGLLVLECRDSTACQTRRGLGIKAFDPGPEGVRA